LLSDDSLISIPKCAFAVNAIFKLFCFPSVFYSFDAPVGIT